MAWKAKNRGARKQGIACQMWLRRRYRFVFAAEMCNAWTPIGGLATQLNHIAALLPLATLESAAYAIRYHNLLVATLADYARARYPFGYHTALPDVHDDARRAILRDNAQPPVRFTAPLASGPNQKPPRGNNAVKALAPTRGKERRAKARAPSAPTQPSSPPGWGAKYKHRP